MRLLNEIMRFVMRNPRATQIAIRAVPLAVREIDRWLSTRSYEVAKQKVDEIGKQDVDMLEQIYRERKGDMSPEVQQAFEEALRSRGRM